MNNQDSHSLVNIRTNRSFTTSHILSLTGPTIKSRRSRERFRPIINRTPRSHEFSKYVKRNMRKTRPVRNLINHQVISRDIYTNNPRRSLFRNIPILIMNSKRYSLLPSMKRITKMIMGQFTRGSTINSHRRTTNMLP